MLSLMDSCEVLTQTLLQGVQASVALVQTEIICVSVYKTCEIILNSPHKYYHQEVLQILNSHNVISFDLGSPVVYYQFCTAPALSGWTLGEQRNLTNCGPEVLGSNSRFEFGRHMQHVLDLDGKFGINGFLHLKCNASYPVQWLAAAVSMTGITLDLSDESIGYGRTPLENKAVTYSQHVFVKLRLLDSHHVLRCASFAHLNRAAEIFLKVGKVLLVSSITKGIKVFEADKAAGEYVKDATSLTVPCVSDIDDYENFTMSKLMTKDLTHVTEYSLENTSYDHRIGFQINEKPERRFVFRCNSPIRQEIIIPVTLNSTMVADLHYSNGKDGFTGFYCSPGNETIIYETYAMSPCQSILQCRFQWNPLPPLTIRQPPHHGDVRVEQVYKMLVMAKSSLTGKIPAYNHGTIQCGGRIMRDGGIIYSYNEIDQWFTGLDGLKYMFSKSFPKHSIIHLSSGTEESMTENTVGHFQCQISTFVLLPNIQFVVEYSSGQKRLKLVSLQNVMPPGFKISKLATDMSKATVSWILEMVLSVNVTKIACYAPWPNSSEWAQSEVHLHVRTEADPNALNTGAVSAISLSTITIIGLTLSLVILWRKYRYAMRRNLTKEEVDEFHLGSKKGGSDENVVIENMPFDAEMIIPSASLKIESTILGEGQFGIVHKGVFQNGTVAVKSSKKTADVDYFKAFLKEIKVMAYIGKHKNIVEFIGAVVEKLEERECFAVIEWSSHGNINSFLMKYSTDKDSSLQVENHEHVTSPTITWPVLISMCMQIAEGMEFLSQKRVIHGDLATRNVLLFDGLVVKITDFGLSRKLYSCSNYVKRQQAPLPWRWMSLESLRYLAFSTQSDVWSFGVTVWEIFTMAQVPFGGITWSTEFVDLVESGYRLSKPQRAPQEVYDWMLRCWDNNPNRRPTFVDSIEFFSKLALESAQEANTPNSSLSDAYLRRWKTESVPADHEFSCEVFSMVSENLAENLS